jgi:hypothetical protein
MLWINRLSELIEDWHYWIQRDGWRSASYAVARNLLRLPYWHAHFAIVARSLLEPLPDPQPRIPIEVREFRQSDVELVRQMDRPSEARLCAKRLARSHRGFLALHNGQPVGHVWAFAGREQTLERIQLRLNPGDFICVDAFTIPIFRGCGVLTALNLACFRVFHEIGYHRAIACIDRHNKPCLASWWKIGSQGIGHVHFIRIGPWRWVRYC